jgi:hypothetical protein
LPLTYRQASLLLLLPVLAFTLWLAWKARGPLDLAELAAYTTHAWFCFTTATHENHPFMIFPFLCLVWWRSRFLAVALAVLVVTFSLNVLLHDFGLAPGFEQALGRSYWRLQMVLSAVNLGVLAGWTWRLGAGERESGRAGERGSGGAGERGSGSIG